MASVSSGSAYATDIVAVQWVYYNQTYNFGYQWMVVMSTQLITRRFLVKPPSMRMRRLSVYLSTPTYAGIGTRGGISRERSIFYVFLGSFSWYFLPRYLFQALGYFSWVCWIVSDNVPVNEMFGYVHGMGMSLTAFDWAQIAYIGPRHGILTPALYCSNAWDSKYMPISSRGSYDHFGATYDVTKIMNLNATFNGGAYKAYSPLYIWTTFAISYSLSLASITATITHAFLYFRKQIWTQARRAMHEQSDIHARLMSQYRQVPEWWYAVIFVVMFAFGVISIELWDTKFPVQFFILALVISFEVMSMPFVCHGCRTMDLDCEIIAVCQCGGFWCSQICLDIFFESHFTEPHIYNMYFSIIIQNPTRKCYMKIQGTTASFVASYFNNTVRLHLVLILSKLKTKASGSVVKDNFLPFIFRLGTYSKILGCILKLDGFFPQDELAFRTVCGQGSDPLFQLWYRKNQMQLGVKDPKAVSSTITCFTYPPEPEKVWYGTVIALIFEKDVCI
ncbi:uncharacterized protein BT62DRAFT_1013784 [Guyanagaster necrorhizus]|uniref:Uncharacterized protein n=1 Tax=Guyanagaster necrorhizus TaxID=856835 RepID=A0A9P7VFQ3_9AGAR|nr:uncharacterized protein BT62DRAFT_1013784 [Guyanagaster necrorhizus MCA 3950]KAG7439560.1 hypothetical protein BT62DRAFT_1013784 [Guyanagaster necrorhizus MCA 3950]